MRVLLFEGESISEKNDSYARSIALYLPVIYFMCADGKEGKLFSGSAESGETM